jgi:dihydroorotate dehydrogenase (fumarate)
MADLTISYMGLKLRNPVIVASSGLTKSAEGIFRCAEAGAGAVVMKSIYEEQYWGEAALAEKSLSYYPEALDYLRKGSLLAYAPQEKCSIIEKVKKEVNIPVVASISCQSPELWPDFALQFQEAGADGLELNIYFLPFDLKTPGTDYEKFHLEILEKVKKAVSIPVAVKLTSQLTSVPFLAHRLAKSGCDALVLFNWFLQPDVNVENLKTKNIIGKGNFYQSLRWVALLAGRIDCDIASSGGVQKYEDFIKQILVGAAAVQVCSLLYQKGLEVIKDLLSALEAWMDSHHYSSIDDFKGELSFKKQELSFKEPEEAKAYFRTQYLKTYSGLE